MDKRKFLDIILKCSHQYDINLNNQNLLIIVQGKDKKISHIEVKFEGVNYMHLTGVTSDLKPNDFFQSCIDNKLSVEHFNIKNQTTGLKLQVLNEAMMIDKTAKMCGEYNNNGYNLYTEKLVGNISVCLGLVKEKNSEFFVPNTVLKEDIRNKTFPPVSKIVCTFKKAICDEKYSQICFVGRNVSISELEFTDEIIGKFSDKLKERIGIPVEEKQEVKQLSENVSKTDNPTTDNDNTKEQLEHCKNVINRTNAILNEHPELKRQFIEAKKDYVQKHPENIDKTQDVSSDNTTKLNPKDKHSKH